MGNIRIIEELIPKSDKIFDSFGNVNYEDRFCLIIGEKYIFDLDIFITKLLASIPKWVKLLLNLRNVIARIYGLKTGKFIKIHLNSDELNLKQGQSLGEIFILLKEKNHLILELKDKHLDFRFSIWIKQGVDKTSVSLSTIVKINNIFGKIYFFFVKPFHRLIIPNILKKISLKI